MSETRKSLRSNRQDPRYSEENLRARRQTPDKFYILKSGLVEALRLDNRIHGQAKKGQERQDLELRYLRASMLNVGVCVFSRQ